MLLLPPKKGSFNQNNRVSKSNIDFINNHIINIKPKQFHNIKKFVFYQKKREIINFYNKVKIYFP